jgi:RimJ/RimL family protein N-acetyltransferase
MPSVELTDGVIVLRRLREEDVPNIAAACSDPETSRFTTELPSPYTEDDARAYVAYAAGCWLGAERRPYAIADTATDDLIGAIEVRLGEGASIGYWVCPGARRRGMATRALTLLARWAVTEGGVERLELTTHPENVASQRVAEKAGFVREGVLRSHTRFREGRRDSVLFSLLPRDLG